MEVVHNNIMLSIIMSQMKEKHKKIDNQNAEKR